MLKDYYKEIAEKQEKYYKNEFETDRLILRKMDCDDIYAVIYNIFLKETGKCIGEIILLYDSEVRYGLFDDIDKRKGYMTEAMKKILEITYENKLEAYIKPKNKASIATIKKLGFEYIETMGEDLVFAKTKKII